MAIAAVAAFNVNLNTNQKSELSFLALANVEALAQQGEPNDFVCKLTKDECKIKISTKLQLQVIRNLSGFGSIDMGAEIDFSDLTQLYSIASWYNTRVRCGTDVTCFDVLKEKGIAGYF